MGHKHELLMPAGSLEKLRFAYRFGADAAYCGVPLFSLRARENEFRYEELKTAVSEAREQNKRLYLTANVFARNLKLKSFREQVALWADLKPDALIMSDPGLMAIVREQHPEIPIHLSVQANCMNWESVKFWQSLGVSRIILSRELRIEEIKEIKNRVPEIELEAFVHGAICIAYSGRCLMSHYMSYRDANQGVCDNSCRNPFKVYEAKVRDPDQHFFVEDLRTEGELYEITEDANGTYLMNAKDLCMIEHLKELSEAGVESFKVEGRTKSLYYVSVVARAYRQAIDELEAGLPFRPEILEELDKIQHRGYHKGFAFGQPAEGGISYEHGETRPHTRHFAGVIRFSADCLAGETAVEIRGPVKIGDEIEVMTPTESHYVKVAGIRSAKGQVLDKAHPGVGIYFLNFKEAKAPLDSFCAPEHSVLARVEKPRDFLPTVEAQL